MPDLAQYRNMVVGAGVRGGRVYSKALKFLENDFSGKNVAFYISSSWAGTPGSYENAKAKFVENDGSTPSSLQHTSKPTTTVTPRHRRYQTNHTNTLTTTKKKKKVRHRRPSTATKITPPPRSIRLRRVNNDQPRQDAEAKPATDGDVHEDDDNITIEYAATSSNSSNSERPPS